MEHACWLWLHWSRLHPGDPLALSPRSKKSSNNNGVTLHTGGKTCG
jgi:hypothetical protein